MLEASVCFFFVCFFFQIQTCSIVCERFEPLKVRIKLTGFCLSFKPHMVAGDVFFCHGGSITPKMHRIAICWKKMWIQQREEVIKINTYINHEEMNSSGTSHVLLIHI